MAVRAFAVLRQLLALQRMASIAARGSISAVNEPRPFITRPAP
jgi:hypothetical protein